MTEHEIEIAFVYHPPNSIQTRIYENIRKQTKNLAILISRTCRDSRETSLALTKLREAVMWANASVALHGAVEKG